MKCKVCGQEQTKIKYCSNCNKVLCRGNEI